MSIEFPLNQLISPDSEIYAEIHRIVHENAPLLAELNSGYHSAEEVRSLLSRITDSEIDESFHANLPLYSDFGRHLRIGKNVFINSGVMFTDLGGITLEDNVLIGPSANIISVNHPLEPAKRRGIILSPVHIGKNAWIGANATILPGVTVGENAVIAAGAVVTKDVPPNTVVASVPAKVIESI
ncbi:DapH/DapD/GlmU-related protein [Testudinibacter sp. P27/CKL/0425]